MCPLPKLYRWDSCSNKCKTWCPVTPRQDPQCHPHLRAKAGVGRLVQWQSGEAPYDLEVHCRVNYYLYVVWLIPRCLGDGGNGVHNDR